MLNITSYVCLEMTHTFLQLNITSLCNKAEQGYLEDSIISQLVLPLSGLQPRCTRKRRNGGT